MVFNSLKYVKILEESGLPREQAEIQIQMIVEIMNTNLATTQDMKDLTLTTQQDIKDLRLEMHQEFTNVRTEMKQGFTNVHNQINHMKNDLENKIIQAEYRLTIKLGTIATIMVGAVAALSKIF